VTSAKPEGLPSVWDKPLIAVEFSRWCLAIAEVELKKLFRDPMELFSRAVQPVLWLVIFGQVFSRVKGIPIGNLSYLDYMSPGILAQSVLFTAIFYGIAVIWERDLGIIHKLLVSPANRGALVVGKSVAAGFRGLVQAVIIYITALALHISIRWEPLAIIGVCFSIFIGSAIFSSFSLIIACIVKTRERFLGIGQVLTMPLFFASNAIYPLELMPKWLEIIARINPLTYLVDALRGLMIQGGQHIHSLSLDFGVMAVIFVLMVVIAAKLYPSLVQ
jgi:ABC-2 type transport system permease protein